MTRKVCQISQEVGNLLIQQAAHELKNFILYSSFENYFSLEGITDLEEYYNKRAQEEKNHHDWILSYVNDADFRLIYPAIEMNPSQEIPSLLAPFTATVDREIQTTQMLYKIYDQAMSEKDYMTCTWLYDKLIKEQIEEESISRMAVDIMELDGDIFNKAERILDLLS